MSDDLPATHQHHHKAPARLEGGGEIPIEIQEMNEKKRLEDLEKKMSNPALSKNTRLFAAIRANDKDRARELLQSGADANASESPPLWLMAGTTVMFCILCCAFSRGERLRLQLLLEVIWIGG